MTLKETGDLKNDVKYILSCELCYNPIDQSKIGKSLNMFLDKSDDIKITQSVRKLIKESVKAREKITYYLETYFFNEDNLHDSDISSYYSESPERKTPQKPKACGKGLMMLRRASQKLDSGFYPLGLKSFNSFP